MKLLPTTLALLLLLLMSSYTEARLVGPGLRTFCASKCKVRCSKAGMRDRCLKYCGLCCLDCKCVPSGTYGNKDQCPCYRDKVSPGRKRKPKCP